MIIEQQAQESLLKELEIDLNFLGIINVQDELKVGAAKFIKNSKYAGLKVNMLSGDTRDKCVSVGWESGIIDPSSGFLEWNFTNENDGIAQMKMVFKEIEDYDNNPVRDSRDY